MRIISFAYTTPALLAGRKTVTRREWDDAYAIRFHAGDQVAAWDKAPRYGGKHVATIELVREPYEEALCDMPDEDFAAEGFAYLAEIGAKPPQWAWRGHEAFDRQLFVAWRLSGGTVYVVRFRLVEVVQR